MSEQSYSLLNGVMNVLINGLVEQSKTAPKESKLVIKPHVTFYTNDFNIINFNKTVLEELLFLVLFDIKGFNNLSHINKLDLSDETKALYKEHFGKNAVKDKDLDTFIERYIIKNSSEPMPVEILKMIKNNLTEQELLGSFGMTTGKILRRLNHSDVSLITPIRALEDQCKDTQEYFDKEYDKLSKQSEIQKEELPPKEAFISKMSLTTVDQLNNLIHNLKAIKNSLDGTNDELRLINNVLYFNTPFTQSLLGIEYLDNLFMNRKVSDDLVTTMAFSIFNGKLYVNVMLNNLVINEQIYMVFLLKLLLLQVIAATVGLELGKVTWNINSVSLDLSQTNTNLLGSTDIVTKITIDSIQDISALEMSNFHIEEIS